jgi:Ni,Fe-hydrogenase III small subunit
MTGTVKTKDGRGMKNDGSPDSKTPGNIMDNRVETDRNLLDNVRSSSSYRGNVRLVTKESGAMSLDLERYRQIGEICAPKAIATLKPEGKQQAQVTLDMGKCILCGRCQEVAPDLFRIENGFAPPTKKRRALMESLGGQIGSEGTKKSYEEMGKELKDKINKIFGRSLAVREVDAGSCNGCEVEITALNNSIYDIERFGIHFVASPRHADVLLVTGVASRNMELALKRTYEATPDPKIVVAVGACACSGGIFGDTYATKGGIGNVVPVDVYVPGCPPRPEAILYGLLSAVDRIR